MVSSFKGLLKVSGQSGNDLLAELGARNITVNALANQAAKTQTGLPGTAEIKVVALSAAQLGLTAQPRSPTLAETFAQAANAKFVSGPWDMALAFRLQLWPELNRRVHVCAVVNGHFLFIEEDGSVQAYEANPNKSHDINALWLFQDQSQST